MDQRGGKEGNLIGTLFRSSCVPLFASEVEKKKGKMGVEEEKRGKEKKWDPQEKIKVPRKDLKTKKRSARSKKELEVCGGHSKKRTEKREKKN